eukprot:5681956-Amphidinium_carterae.1
MNSNLRQRRLRWQSARSAYRPRHLRLAQKWRWGSTRWCRCRRWRWCRRRRMHRRNHRPSAVPRGTHIALNLSTWPPC